MIRQIDLLPNIYWSHVHEQAPDGDTKSAVVLQNIGPFRLEYYFAFKEEVVDLKKKTKQLSKAISPFALLGNIDKITQTMVNFN